MGDAGLRVLPIAVGLACQRPAAWLSATRGAGASGLLTGPVAYVRWARGSKRAGVGAVRGLRAQNYRVDNFGAVGCLNFEQQGRRPQTRMDTGFPIMCRKVVHTAYVI